MINEFQLIKQFFQRDYPQRADIHLGIGDDAAVLAPRPNHYQVISTDTLVNQVHLLESWSAYDIGYRALAVNLSDLAAMGATPRWALLALTLPHVDEDWLTQFAHGFSTLAEQYQVALIGGDMTRGPLAMTVTVGGDVRLPTKPLTRTGARAADDIYLTGQLGLAALALLDQQQQVQLTTQDRQTVYQHWLRPPPHVVAGQLLLPMASAAIDVSDGLAQDLQHLLTASQVGARLEVATLPIAPALTRYLPVDQQVRLALTGGDDYQLCFTLEPARRGAVELCFAEHDIALSRIGVITPQPGLQCIRPDNTPFALTKLGYQHWMANGDE